MQNRIRILGLLAIVSAIGLPLRAQSPVLVISGATLIDGTGGPTVGDAVVVVSDGTITAAGPRATVRVPADATVIDGKGKYLLPGLIDTSSA
jgi:imidazolonepropionase-like amidohydrolase